ncbi:Alkaline phosphatase [Rhodovulum sp. P5]|uniref:ExeM/NucH family extracellular endonuclease n=1 Tax=Rhodovulum sp. P5 TaxID=1564506 RepID=UPI0009C24625|nr:ExeM/NucH family extracellular endonuclease [Rhodovulum sp. P5]ARE41168.1 Alkaline phosphatase [Rhodovulum sp. P5]
MSIEKTLFTGAALPGNALGLTFGDVVSDETGAVAGTPVAPLAVESLSAGTDTEETAPADADGAESDTSVAALALASTDAPAAPSFTSLLTLTLGDTAAPSVDDGIAWFSDLFLDIPAPEATDTLAALISEFHPNPAGSDPSTQTVELSGEAGAGFDLWLVSVENDGINGLVDRAENVTGTFDSNGLATVDVADLENPSFTYILTDSFTGQTGRTDIDTDDDGTVDDLSAFGSILDAVGICDSVADADVNYADDTALDGTAIAYTGAEPQLVFRDASRGDWYAVNAPGDTVVFDAAGDTIDPAEFNTDPTAIVDSFGAINPTLGDNQPLAALFSEFHPNPAGSDPSTQTVELSGEAGASFDLWLVSVENDGINGLVDRAENVTGTFDANGLATVDVADLENPSFTYILTDSFTGQTGRTDIDTDDDGTVDDLSAFGTILDAVGISDSVTDADVNYADDTALDGTAIAYTGAEPQLVFRDASRGDWYAVNAPGDTVVFDAAGDTIDPSAFDTDPTAIVDSLGNINPTLQATVANLVITEIMQNPSAVSDTAGEWFEIFNAGSAAVDLDGYVFSDNGADSFTVSGSLVVEVGDYLVFGINGDTATNGGVDVDYVYSGFFLANGDDEIVITDAAGTEIDRVEYDGGPEFPDPTGASMFLIDPEIDNAIGANWAVSTVPYGDGDLGTPGFATAPEPEVTAIGTLQGSGFSSPFEDTGEEFTIRGVVTAVFMADDEIGGFFIQDGAYADQDGTDQTGDGDDTTSDGVFVRWSGALLPQVYDIVTVTGTMIEDYGNTEISATYVTDTGNDATSITAAFVDPTFTDAEMEVFEGMYVAVVEDASDPLTGTISVTENYGLGRYGEIEVAQEVNMNPTQVIDPQTDPDAVADLAARNADERITIDDGSNVQNRDVKVLIDDGDETGLVDGAYDIEDAAGPTLRIGAEFESITGALDYAYGDWRVQYDFDGPDGGALTPVEGTNDRPDLPDVGGTLQVASFNVLNFFTTIDENGNTTLGGHDPRGADSTAEVDRQLEKLVTGILELEAEVVALQELENGGFGTDSAIATLVAALNTAEGDAVWSFVDFTLASGDAQGLIGTDAITTGMIYRNDAVTEIGNDVLVFEEASAQTTYALAEVLNQVASDDDKLGDYQRNRPSVAASFETADGAVFTVVSNHFKSKGDSNLEDVVLDAQAYVDGGGTLITQADIDALIADGNYDQGDGQGFWNAARTDAANEVAAWMESDPTGTGDSDVLILGDLNSYGQEAPIDALVDAGYTHEVGGGADDYGYTYYGEQGALDHAFSSETLASQVTGAAEWHINGDEPVFLDYNLDYEDAAFFDGDSGARSSDHDPVLVGLNLESDAPQANIIIGEGSRDRLKGTDGVDHISFGDQMRSEYATGYDDADVFIFDATVFTDGTRGIAQILDYTPGEDAIFLDGGTFDETLVRVGSSGVYLTMDGDGDRIVIHGVSDLDQITFVDEFELMA